MDLPALHYHTTQLADGVHALIHLPHGWGIGNVGIIDLGDQTLLFDSSMTPASALEAKHIAERVTGRSVDIILNSHYHNDHIWGNQIFPRQTQIVSSTKTRNLIDSEGREELSWNLANASERLVDITNQYESESDTTLREDLSKWKTYYEALAVSVSEIEVRMPDLTFDHHLTFHGSKRSAEVITFQNGHTADDAILFLPEDGIVFMADLLFVDSHPFLVEAEPDKVISILDEVLELGMDIFVPGHGSLGTEADLNLMKEYVHSCQALSGEFLGTNLPATDIDEIPIPTKFDSWQFSNFYYLNLRYMVSRFQR